MVAKRVRDSLLLKLSTHWEVHAKTDDVLREISLNGTGSLNSENTSFLNDDEEPRASVVVEKTEKHTNMFQTLKESFFEAYKVMDRELKMYTNIDCLCSGITAVTLIKQGQDLVNSNVGDSRAVMGTRDKDDYLTAIRVSVPVATYNLCLSTMVSAPYQKFKLTKKSVVSAAILRLSTLQILAVVDSQPGGDRIETFPGHPKVGFQQFSGQAQLCSDPLLEAQVLKNVSVVHKK
ncbi:putative protein phosphatase 2C 33 isoform X1 [Apium graveolens]|uniref:putative protein phosphatase 2C 33 isoform X1 n=1 Tax=Apium graveolens TaxID=4045 RepID=UPI003D7BB954